MLTCLPQGVCPWSFLVPEAGNAEITLFTFRESGTIQFGGVGYTVTKEGLFSPTWTLARGEKSLATARVVGLLRAIYIVETQSGRLRLEPQGIFQRTFSIQLRAVVVGMIRANHAFTRRATIECNDELPILDQLFAFWLVALRWRRSANDSAASPST